MEAYWISVMSGASRIGGRLAAAVAQPLLLTSRNVFVVDGWIMTEEMK